MDKRTTADRRRRKKLKRLTKSNRQDGDWEESSFINVGWSANVRWSTQPFLDDSRIAGSKAVIGNIANDDRTGRNYAALTYRNTGANYHPSPKPRVVSNGNGVGSFVGATSLSVINGMVGCQQLATRPNLHIVAYSHHSTIEDDAAIVEEAVLSYNDAMTVVTMERGTHRARFRYARY